MPARDTGSSHLTFRSDDLLLVTRETLPRRYQPACPSHVAEGIPTPRARAAYRGVPTRPSSRLTEAIQPGRPSRAGRRSTSLFSSSCPSECVRRLAVLAGLAGRAVALDPTRAPERLRSRTRSRRQLARN